jgi:hypothetical protein
MDRKEELKNGLKDLIDLGSDIVERVKKVKKGEVLELNKLYQSWYTSAIKILEILANDRLDEFISYYRIDPKRKEVNAFNYVIQDYFSGRGVRKDRYGQPLFDIEDVVFIRIYNQVQIIHSLNTRIESVFSDVQGSLLAELQDRELATAEDLAKINLRAAGSLAGVVLENHLQKVAQNHQLNITKKNPTISDINDPLKDNNIYDIPTWRKIQYLADIRNLCSHKKETEPTKEQVGELISGVNEIIKTIF